jgi:cell division septum initiation protein DivIVA
MDRDLEQQLQELQKQFAGLAKTLGSSSKTVLKNTRDNKTFGNVQKMLGKSMDDYLKRVKKGDGIFHEFSDAIEAAQKDVKGFGRTLRSMP